MEEYIGAVIITIAIASVIVLMIVDKRLAKKQNASSTQQIANPTQQNANPTKLKPDKLPEGFSRLYIVLSFIPAIFLCGIGIIGLGYGVQDKDMVFVGVALIFGGIASFYVCYYILAGITLAILWIVEGFKKPK